MSKKRQRIMVTQDAVHLQRLGVLQCTCLYADPGDSFVAPTYSI